MRRTSLVVVSGLSLSFAAAHAGGMDDSSDLRFDADATRLALATEPPPGEAPQGAAAHDAGAPGAPAPEKIEFLMPGRWWGGFIGGYARGISDQSNDFNAAFTLSTFLIERLELLMEFGGWYFNQPEDDAVGFNWNLIFRFHVFTFGDRKDWTVFLDGGAGLLVTTDVVPAGGTGFNFTPRAGFGFTHRLSDESETRLVLGLRWHHISNARINGDDRNPGRDGINLYVGLEFPF